MNKTLKELEQQIDAMREAMSELETRIEAERVRIATETFGVRVGSIVRYKGRDFKVQEVEPCFLGDPSKSKPWVTGNPRKKDGSFGSQSRHLYSDWELVDSVEGDVR